MRGVPSGKAAFELCPLETPTPVAPADAGRVHAGVAAETEKVLQRRNGQAGGRAHSRADHEPGDIGIVPAAEHLANETAHDADQRRDRKHGDQHVIQ